MIGRVVTDIWADDRVADPGLPALVGGTIEAVTRRGKVVQLLIDGDQLGLHFGMTGRVVVDGAAPIEALAYSEGAVDGDEVRGAAEELREVLTKGVWR